MASVNFDDLDSLTDECYSFVTDPKPSRGDRQTIEALHDLAPHVVEVLESMVLDGVDERHEVAEYISFVFGS